MCMPADDGAKRRTKDQTNDRDNLRVKAEQIILFIDRLCDLLVFHSDLFGEDMVLNSIWFEFVKINKDVAFPKCTQYFRKWILKKDF